MKKIQINRKIFHAQRLEELILSNGPYYSKCLQIQYSFYQNSSGVFHRKNKFVRKNKRPQIVKTVFGNKNKSEGITIPDFQLYYKTKTIQAVLYWQKNRHMDQQNRIKTITICPHIYSQIMYNKGARIYNGDRVVSSINGVGKMDNYMQKNETVPLSYSIHKNQLIIN